MKENYWLGGNRRLPTPKWLVIARNEYKIATSSIRSIRRYFPILIIIFLAIHFVIIAPAIANLFMTDFLAFIITAAAVPIVQILLFVFFFFFLVFPISETLREVQSNQIEIFLTSPISPSDVLLGEFLGKMPFYGAAIAFFVAIFTALLSPLGIDIAQSIVIVVATVITLLSAFWIGTVISAVLRTRLGKSSRGKDIGRALAVVIVIPPIALIYSIIGGGLLQALVDPATNQSVRAIMGFLPSSWVADIFMNFAANPGNIFASSLDLLVRVGGLVIFFAGSLFLGAKIARRAYTLENVSFVSSRAKPDGLFYKTVRSLGGKRAFGTLLVSVFKDYGRRLENLSWIVYVILLIAMIRVFFGEDSADPMEQVFSLSLFAIPLLAGFVVGAISRGKETIFLLKKAPSGMQNFIKARFIQSLLVAVPIAASMTAVLTLLTPQPTVPLLLLNVVLASLRSLSMVAIILGLALVNPTFSAESRERNLGIMINLMIVVFATIGMEIGFSRLGLRLDRILPGIDPIIGAIGDTLLMTTIFLIVGRALIYLGSKRLEQIE